MNDMNQEFANLTPEQRQLVELMLRQSEESTSAPSNTISPQRAAPLSFAQQRLWFLEQLDPGNAAYNLPLAMRVDGKLDIKALTQSLNEVVARHEVLRTTFVAEEGQPTQVIASILTIALPLIDLPPMSQTEQAVRVQQLVLDEAGQPFNLEHGPLLRASLLRLSLQEHILLVTMHHSVSDGWSISVLMREMAMLYHAFSSGQPSPLPDLPMQYRDYAVWQRKWLTGEVLEQQLGYWKRQFSGDPPALDLPTDYPRPLVQTFQGAITKFQVSRDLTDRLKALGQQHSATLFMVLLAAFQTLLYRYTGQNDLIVGTPIANRNRAEIEGLIGLFVNTLALRVDLAGNPTFDKLLQRVRQGTLGAYAHQDLPFERLVEELQLKRDMSRTPLFQVMLVLQNMPMPTIEAAGLKLTSLEMANSGTAKFDLTLTLTETPDGLRGALEYRTDLFQAATIERLLGHYQTLLAGIITDPGQRLSELPLLAEAERHQLLVEWNQVAPFSSPHFPLNFAENGGSEGGCIHELFEAQAEKTPEAVAVVFENEHLTYAELNTRANQLAHYLRSLGVGPDVLVGICVERSQEMIVGLLGILKSGGAYVPLDPNYPKNRLAYIINDSCPAVLLTQSALVLRLPEQASHTICLDSDWQERIAIQPVTAPVTITDPSNLAYVLFTSGTTGQPKGVALQHRNAAALIQWVKETYSPDELSGVLASTSIGFDLSVYEIFGTLTLGGCVILAENVLQLPTLVAAERVRIINTVPSAMAELLRQGSLPGSVTTVNLAGEALSTQLVDELYRSTNIQRVIDAYGPTENTTYSTFVVRQVGMAATIGRPLPHWTTYILDKDLQPVPVGVSGELYIGGAGVARGYLNRPDLTAERFIPNPFAAEATTVDGGPKTVENHRPPSTVHGRLYRTGDLARYLPDGNIEYLGRIDYQVKVRGFRIELGEIEAALMEHVDIQATVVVVREDTPGAPLAGTGKRLVAYLVIKAGHNLPETAELRSKLAQSLPEYMIPSAFVLLDNLPLTPNGKIDRKALPAPEPVTGSISVYVAPQNELEQIISQVWSEVLKVQKIGIHDNFFDLGGHSLLMSRTRYLLREKLGRDLTMVELFQYSTVGALARHLSQANTELAALQAGSSRAELRRSLMQQPEEGIAVIGLSGRYPDAKNVDEFWQNLCAAKESISFFSDEELLVAGVDRLLLQNPDYVKAGTVVEHAEDFDYSFFGYNPREAAIMDPQQRVFLETTYEALERAGYDPSRYTGRIGVFASISANTYLLNNLASNPGLLQSGDGYQVMLSNDKDFLTTRVSYKLNLKGPSLNVQTACSSSLVAVHLACQSLLRGESDMALAGGVSISFPQQTGYLYVEGAILSPDGHCRAFDAQSKGTVGGNGAGVVVLKRLSQALLDGDMISAVIKGTAINNDGSLKVGYTAPSVEGQAEVIAEAQAVAGVEPGTISYVETHGTATALGDPIEIAALTQAFCPADGNAQKTGFCAIGSVKTNVGHLDAAAGVTGLIKTVLALQNRLIPPSLHFTQPNPTIDFEHSPFYVNAALKEWQPTQTPRRAGVSSFGIGGTNAHAILEESPVREPSGPSRPWQLLLLSAKTDMALEKATFNLAEHFEMHSQENLADAAYTLQVGRQILSHRRVALCQNMEDAVTALKTLDPKRTWTGTSEEKERRVTFMFTGQGAQYVDMGRELYALEASFRKQVDHCAELLQPHLGLDLRAILYPAESDRESATKQLGQTWLTQPALFTIEYTLAQLWMSWGIQPQGMIGHSIGEYVAACLAGVFSLEDALALVAARGRLMQELPGGAMLAARLPESEAQTLLGSQLSLAAVNGSSLCVFSGPLEHIATLEEKLKAQGIECTRLHTSHAFHSAMMDPILERFRAEFRQVKLHSPQIRCVSNLTGQWLTAEDATDPAYWVRHLRQTVRFGDGLSQVLQDPAMLLLEIGPGRTLTTLALKHPDRKEQNVLPSLRHVQDTQSDEAFFLTALGKLWLAGVQVDWSAFYRDERRQRIPLPTYPFERQRCWIEPSTNKIQPGANLIYKKQDLADWFYLPSWVSKPLQVKTSTENVGSTLIFVDEDGLGMQLAASLVQRGGQVIIVQAGESFAKLDDRLYRLAPGQANDYVALFNDLLAHGTFPQVVIHLWNVTQESQTQLGLKETETAQEMGFYSLLFLAQVLGLQDTPLRLMVVSNGLQKVTGDENISLGKTTLLGPVRTISTEYAHIRSCSIDIDLAQPQPDLVDLLMDEATSAFSDMIVAYRDSCRWVQTFEPIRLGEVGESAPRLKPQGVYLITGGLGGIGLALARHMAQTVQARLVLIGRSAMPPAEAWDQWFATHDEDDTTSRRIRQIQELEALGAEVMVFAADVSIVEQMQSVISQALQHFGRLNGVVHAAGVPGGGIMQLKTREMVEKVFTPKIKGTLVLAELLKDQRLDFMILCSSINSVVSTLGQVDYCAANGFMNAFAHSRYLSGTPVISINWNAWNEVGMTVDANKQKPGIPMIQSELANGLNSAEGVQVFNRILTRRLSEVFISKNDLATVVADSQAWNVELSGYVVQDVVMTGTLHPRPKLANPYAAPRNKNEQTLAAVWQELLGIEQIGIHDNFFELGGDSLLVMRVVARARQNRLYFTHQDFFQHQTIAELAEVVKMTSLLQVTKDDLITGVASLAPNQHWFFDQNFPQQHRFNTATLFEVDKQLRLDPILVKEVIQHLLVHHDALRSRFVQQGSEWRQFIALPDENIPFSVIDLSTLPEQERMQTVETICSETQPTLNLSDGPLLRVILFDLGPNTPSYLFLMIHHLVTDGFSNSILMQDFMTSYQQLSQGETVQLPAKTTSFKDWSERLIEYAQSPTVQQELEHWQTRPGETLPGIPPADDPNPSYIFESSYLVSGMLNEEETRILLQDVLKTYDMQLIEVMLAVMAETIGQTKGDRSLFVDILRHGRDIQLENVDLSRTMGWFVIHYPLLLRLDDIGSLEEALPLVREQYRRPLDGGIGYDLLRYMSGNDGIEKTLFPRPLLIFSHESFEAVSAETLIRPINKPIGESSDKKISWPYLLELRTMMVNNQLHWAWTSGETVYPRSAVEKLSLNFAEIIKRLCRS